MTRALMTGNAAAAWGARLARADYVPAFPITPQTEIIETLARWIERSELAARLVMLESEHSMVTAAGAAALGGVRVFTATSSQGLLYAMEMLYAVAGWRAPFVLVNVSRALAAPITLEPDHDDVLAARDSGFLQFHCATAQEVVDSILLAYRISEDPRVRLPALVNFDGFHVSFTREPVELPDPKKVDRFLPAYDARATRFRPAEATSHGVAVLGGSAYSYFRYQAHLAALAALEVQRDAAADFLSAFGRSYAPLEEYRSADAELVFVMIGSFATKARQAVDAMRRDGQSIGLVRPRLLRPFPAGELQRALAGKSAAIVVDQNLSLGRGGVLHTELAAALYDSAGSAPRLLSFVGGLGGRDITAEEFHEMARTARAAVRERRTPAPRLLFNAAELREVQRLQGIAGVARRGDGDHD